MRVLARVMGLSIMFILTSIIFLQLSSFNIHEMELSDATTTAMTSTQIVEQENIEDDIYDTTNARKVIDSNTKYQQQYVDDFAMLVGAKSTSVTTRDGETSATLYAGLRNKHDLNTLPNAMSYTNQTTKLTENVAKNTVGGTRSTYKITFMETDWETGILSVKVQSTYAMLNGEYKTIETYKTNIIENNGVDTIKRFNIFFNANGGVCNESVRNVQKWKKYGELPIPQRKHYTFLGWYTELNGGTKVSANTIMGNGDVTLYAHWEANPFKNTIKHYVMDGDKKFYLFDTTNYTRRYEEKYQLSASEQGLTVPKGLALNTYGTTHVTGSAKEYPFGTQVTQKAEDMEYEFYYKTIDYKVTYNLNGGTNANGNKSSYNVLHGFNLGTPTKRGYTFLGWYDENGQRVTTLNGNIDNDFKNKDDMYNKLNTRTVGNKVLTAKWKANEYTITYDGNGATSGSMSGNVATYDSAYAIQKNQYVRKGYTFIGWTTKAEGTSDGYNWTSYTKDGQWSGDGFSDKLTNYNVSYWSGTWKFIDGQYGIQNGKMKLYAMWQINQYKIDLNSVLDGKEYAWSHTYGSIDIYVNGKQVCNDVSDANVTLNYGDKWELKDIKATKGHYYVKTTYSEYGVNGKNTGTSGTIGEHGIGLYPEWNTKVLGIHYHRNYSASDTTTANQSAKYGVDGQKLDANPWGRAGYAFLGWSTDKNATKAEYSNQQSVSNDWIDTKYPNIHLYAVWKPYTLTVRYHNDGAQKWESYTNGVINVEGKDVVETETVKYDEDYAHSEYGLLDVGRFARKGYHDNGNWKIGSKTSTNKVKDAGGTLPNSKGQGLATYLGVINAFEKGDVTVDLYPEWIANTYTVKYNGNGENSGTTPSSSHTYDTAKNLTANGYVKNGYQFVGWNTQANGSGTSYSDKQSVKNLTATNGGTVTLYAQWKPYTLTIRYHGDGALKDGSTNVSGKDVLLEEKVAYNGSYSHLKDATKLSKDGYTPNNGNWIVGKNGTTVVSSSKSLANGETVGIYLGCISSLHKSNVTVDLYPEWIANTWTVKYDANGGNGDMENTTHVWNGGIKVRKNTFEKPLYTFRGWNLSRVNSGKTEWLYAKSDNSWAGAGSWYESGKQPSGYVKCKLADEQVLQACTLIKNDVITAHAQWTPNTYYVTYDANGGSGAPAQQAFVADSGTKLSTTKPTRTGYTFVNWDYMGNKFNPGDAIPTGWGSFTLKAQWKANTYTYNIKYVSSSGASLGTATVNGTYGSSKSVSAPAKTGYTTPTAQTVKFDSTSAKTITFTYNLVGYSIGYNVNGGNALSGQRTSYNVESSAYTLPTPSRTGYTFAGWTGSNGSTPQKSVTIAKGSTGNKSYTANWSINTYSIGYNLNGGSINGQKTSYNVTTESFTLPTPTRSGYTFTGWTGSNGNTPQKSVTIAKGSTGNKSYTANWEANAYTLTVNPNGGNINGTTSAKSLSPPLYYNGGNWWNLSGEKPSRTGYTFEGWYTSANGGTKIYNADGTCTNEGTYWKNSSYVHTGNLSVYAHWKANTYTITSKYFYYYQNNTWKQFDTKTEQRTYGSSFAPHNVNSPTGYHAGNNYGYYTEKSEYLGDGTVGTNNITVNQNIIVHVHYYPDTYAITYKPNGGSGSDQTQTVTYGISWTSKGAIYSKSGYTQTSWNTQANGSGTKYSLSTVQTDKQLSNVTLYAQWTPNTYAQTIQARYQNADGTWGSYSTVKSGNANYNATYSWSRAADSTYKAASISYTVTQANTKYVDVYRQMYNLKVTGDSGVESISGNGDYYAGSTASSTYKIKAGYHMTTLVGQGPDAGQTWTGYNNKTGTLGDTWGMSRNRQAYINTAKNTVSIAYGVNGGTINSSDYSINQWGYVQNKSNNPWFHVVTYGSKDDPYNASTFGLTRTGYTFVRWQNEKTGTNYDQDTQYDSTVYQGSSSSETTANTSSVNCYVKAIWSLDNYSIGYNLNGGSISGQKTSYNVTTENFTLPTPTRSGYTFTGWTGSNGSTPQKSVTIAKGSTGNKSYTANWSVNMYYFDLNGYLDGASSGGISGYGTCDIYMNGTLVANDVADFWQQYAYGTKYEIKDIKAATGKQYLGVQSGSLSGTITGTTSTYLSFKTNSTTIQYDANGGSGAPGNQTKVAGQTLTLSSTKPSRSGYTFRGWKEITKTNKYYQPGSSYTNDYNGQTITMRAVWVKNSGDWGNATRRDYGWYQTMNNGKYAVSHWIYYYIDTNARQIRVVVDNQRLQSLTNRHAYYYGTNNGWQLNYDSGMNDIQYGRVYDAWDEFNAQYGGGSNAGVHPVAAIYKYNDDGSLPAINLYSQMIMNIPGYNASYYGFIQQDWKLCQIQGLFPKISPLYSDDVSNMPQLSSEGMDDETMFDGAKSKQKVEEIPEIIDGDINSGIIESTIKKSDIPNVDKQPEKAATLPFGSAACGDDKKGIRTEPTTGDGGLN
ncbi:MAG: InlB B-repeat-containing protein [Holdemanella sp.]|nr:InlB B-repeat-containing protein [Holdemanella sp.]